jgi:ABC-type Fe3+-siderophore transport system permease subunit
MKVLLGLFIVLSAFFAVKGGYSNQQADIYAIFWIVATPVFLFLLLKYYNIVKSGIKALKEPPKKKSEKCKK